MHGAYVCTHGVMCANKLHCATCGTENPDLANLLAPHSLPTASDSQNSFFSAFGTSTTGRGGGGGLKGGWGPMCVEIQVRPRKSCMPYVFYTPTLGYSTAWL